jgi:hypothetical protein
MRVEEPAVPYPRLLLVVLSLLLPCGAVSAEDDALKPLDEFFRGKITKLRRGVVTLKYDFSDEKQAEDWYENLPFPIKRAEGQGVRWDDGKLEISGSTGASHVALFKGDIEVTCRVKLDSTEDVGGMITPETDSHDFATFTIIEKYFHRWDNQRGGQHTVMKYGDQFKKVGFGDTFVGFRYVARQPPEADVIAGRTLDLDFGVTRGKLWMEIEDQKLSGKDMGVKLKTIRAGFYTIKGRMRVDDVTIEGKLDPAWLQHVGVSPTLANPIESD